MKITHDDVVKKYQSLGFVACVIYPGMEITIMAKGDIFVTIKKNKVRNGNHEPGQTIYW